MLTDTVKMMHSLFMGRAVRRPPLYLVNFRTHHVSCVVRISRGWGMADLVMLEWSILAPSVQVAADIPLLYQLGGEVVEEG